MRSLVAAVIALLLISCSDKKPKNVLAEDKLKAVLTDLYIAEAYSTQVNDSAHQIRNRNVDSLAVFYNTILSHHNITSKDLAESIDWYKHNPKELDSVYAKMIPELSRLQSEYSKK